MNNQQQNQNNQNQNNQNQINQNQNSQNQNSQNQNIELNECVNADGSLNIIRLLRQLLSPVYFSNIILYICVFLYLSGADYMFYIVYPLLWINAILGTLILTVYWKKVGRKFAKMGCLKNNTQIPAEQFDNLIAKYKNELVLLRLIGIVIHWVPIYFFYNSNLIRDYEPSNAPNSFISWIYGILLCCIYMIMSNKTYGNIPYGLYISIYPLLLLAANTYLYQSSY